MEKYIKKLLVTDSRAIIPQFGAIQALREDQVILSYNAYLNFDDGKIKALIQEEEGLSEEDASLRISRAVDSYNNRITDGETVTLEGIGTFTKNEYGSIAFEQDPNYTEEQTKESGITFSEPSFTVVEDQEPANEETTQETTEETTTTDETTQENTEENSEETTEETTEQTTTYVYKYKEEKSRKWLILLLLLLLLLICAGVYLFVFNKDNAVYRMVFGAAQTEQVEAEEQPAEEAPAAEEPKPEPKQETAKPKQETKQTLEPTVARKLEKRYNIIVGAYKDESAAIAKVSDLQTKGFSESFVGIRKNHFVAVIGSFSNITQAEAMQEQIVEGKYHIESWITNSGENE